MSGMNLTKFSFREFRSLKEKVIKSTICITYQNILYIIYMYIHIHLYIFTIFSFQNSDGFYSRFDTSV